MWSNKQQAIQIYKDCIGTTEYDAYVSWSYEQIDSMLYLSYIYLTDAEYKDVNKANILLAVAKNAILFFILFIVNHIITEINYVDIK